jgi:hypothetical protein
VRVLITGTREDGPHCQRAFEVLTKVWSRADNPTLTVVHGACPTGVDAYVDTMARDAGFSVETYPADWDTHGKAAGPLRNKQMVDLGADLCLAFPKGVSRGTRGCLALAQAAGIDTRVVEL